MSDNSLNTALSALTPPSSLQRQRVHHKWSENYSSNLQPGPIRNLFSPEKTQSNNHGLQNNVVSTPLRAKTPQRTYRNTPKRSNSSEYCGLTAEITRELRMKTPIRMSRPGSAVKAPAVNEPINVNGDAELMSSGYVTFNNIAMQTPPRVSRKQDDIFLSKPNELALAPTISSSYEDVSPKEDMPTMQPSSTIESTSKTTGGLPPSLSKAKRGISTPIRMKNKLFSAKKLKKCLTPPREGFASHLKQLRSAKKLPSADEMDAPSSPASLSTALPGADEFKIHSTEYDPFDFQCELPSKKEMGVHSKIVHVVDSYTGIHLEFNFAMLAGLTRGTLEKEYERSSVDKPMIAGACHRDVVKSILDCEDDLVVEGFFREYVGDNDASVGSGKTPVKSTPLKSAAKTTARDDRIEVVIFSSEKLRQIIVCFRGSTASQAKPLKLNYFGKEGSSLLHRDHQVRVLSAFRDAYFGTPMEEAVFALLANLATRKPFFDVVMTGHSFGAALATIGAMRYATAHPMMRVSCNVFGCPRVGGEEWRQLVHSLANLKVFRIENASDPYVILPSGTEWVQVGHVISIIDLAPTETNSAPTLNANGSSSRVQFTARRFDRDRVISNNGMFDLIKCPKVNLPRGMAQGISAQGKVDHEMKSYVEKLISSGDRWFTDFVGMNGNGVISFADNERRLLA